MEPGAKALPPFAVHLDLLDGMLVARIDVADAGPKSEFAFYLQAEGKRIETRWYSADATACFKSPPHAGKFKAVGFVRSGPGGQTTMVSSKPLVVDTRQQDIDAKQEKTRAAQLLRVLPVGRFGLEGLRGALEVNAATRFDIRIGKHDYACLVTPRKSNRLFVILNGAVSNRAQAVLPRFSRFSWAADFPGTVICISDPTLHLDPLLPLGWYFGSADADVMPGLADVVLATADALGVARHGIMAYGSSGGGFAALQLAARLGQGATAIAINAQIETMRYSIKPTVDKFLAVCLPTLSRDDAGLEYPERLSATAAWSQPSAATARCLLVQNTGDRHHHREHFLPFIEHFGVVPGGVSEDGRIGAYSYFYPNGHGAEPRNMLPTLLSRADALRWPAANDSTGAPGARPESATGGAEGR